MRARKYLNPEARRYALMMAWEGWICKSFWRRQRKGEGRWRAYRPPMWCRETARGKMVLAERAKQCSFQKGEE